MKRYIKNPDWATDTDDAESNAFRELMLSNDELKDEPSVGIFWYDVDRNELFGVTSTLAQDVPFQKSTLFDKPVKTCRKLHYQTWAKEFHRGRDKRYQGDYTQVPRGRVFEIEGQGFVVCVGSWINEYPSCKELVIDEFDLPKDNTTFKVDEHWDLGHGWSDKFI